MAQTIDAQVTLARQFERKAAEDARFLASVLPSIDASDTQVGNIAQQAVEKTLKAVLAHRGMNYQVNRQFKRVQIFYRDLRGLGNDAIGVARRVHPIAFLSQVKGPIRAEIAVRAQRSEL